MARGRESRKGKKEWRRNISTSEHEDAQERRLRDERSGGPLGEKPDESLFFVDKKKGPVLPLRKVDRVRQKTLRCDSVLARASLVPPVNWGAPRGKKSGARVESKTGGKRETVQSSLTQLEDQQEPNDLWGNEDLGGQTRGVGTQGNPKAKRRRSDSLHGAPLVPAVEVDLPGCSFNPEFEEHQDALAIAVAREVVKEAKKELEPTAPPLDVLASGPAYAVASQLELYSGLEDLLPEHSSSPEEGALRGSGGGDERIDHSNGGKEEEGSAGPPAEEEHERSTPVPGIPSKPVRVSKLTRADLNRKIRRREQEAALATKQRRKKLNKDAGMASEISAHLEEEEVEKHHRRLRKETSRKERRLEAPPRLGKHKFEPEHTNVLLTEEVTGSLRQVKGCYTLARDRFKSLQKRGILEPRLPVRRKAAKRRRIVEVGTKGQKEREMHAEILQMRAIRQGTALALHVE